MPIVSVTFNVTQRQLPRFSGIALEGTVVRVFSTDGETFFTQGTTDENGQLVLDLEDNTTYWVRFFKEEHAFESRLSIDVEPDPTPNVFSVEGQNLIETPVSAVPYLCRVTGYARGADGAPRSGVSFEFTLTRPCIVGGDVMAVSSVIVVSGEDGWVEVELVRDAIYECSVTGMEDQSVQLRVPDEAGCRLTDLIWPYIAELIWTPASVSVAVGESVTVATQILLSSGLRTPFEYEESQTLGAVSFVQLDAEDRSIASVEANPVQDSIIITGESVGTTTIVPVPVTSREAPRVPEPARTLPSLVITVTA